MKLKVREVEEREVTITPEYCYERAANALQNPNQFQQTGSTPEAAEWRLLGDSLARMVGAA